MKEKENIPDGFRILDDEDHVCISLDLVNRLQNGLAHLSDVAEEEHQMMREEYLGEILPNRSHWGEKVVADFRCTLIRLQAMDFTGVPTASQLESQYAKDAASHIILLKHGMDLLAAEVVNRGTTGEALSALRRAGHVDDDDLRIIYDLLETYHEVDGGRCVQLPDTGAVSRLNELFLRLSAVIYSGEVVAR